MTDLYSAPAAEIDYDAVRSFIRTVEETNAATESRTFEFKEQLQRSNVAEAVAALANADGGLVFVGVADKRRGDERLVGVTRSGVESVVNSLRSVLPNDAFPEVIPVAVPTDPDRVIVLLRVDADQVIHPVVLGGTVHVRYPGQTVKADREQITALVSRATSTPSHDGLALPHLPIEGARSILFPEDAPDFAFQLRLIGSATLPYRVRQRPWLDTAARSAIRDTFRASPLPDDMWFERPPLGERDDFTWHENDARATWGRYGTQAPTFRRQRDPAIRVGGAYVTLQGRVLRVLVGVGVQRDPAHDSAKLRLADLYRGLLALVVTHRDVVCAVATSLDAADTMRFTSREAWLLPGESRTVEQILDLDEFAPRGPGGSDQMLHFVPLVAGDDIGSLDRLVQQWLEIAMLDAGAREFEHALVTQPRPYWAADPAVS